MSYSPHSNFVAPARNTSEVWRTFVGIAVCLLIYALLLSSIMPLLDVIPTADDLFDEESAFSPSVTLLILLSFGAMTFALATTVSIIHKRSPLTLIGDTTQATKHFWQAVKAMLFFQLALIILPPYGSDTSEDIAKNLALGTWIFLLPLSLVGLLIQTSAEELLFRGYLQQQLAARFSSPLVWMGLPAIFFALGHFDSANGDSAMAIILWAGLFSLAASDLVARTGNLGAAIGLHFVNNAFGMLILSYPGEMSGLSLYVLTKGPDEFGPTSVEITLEFAMLAISWLAIRLAVRR